ncbi:MAG: CAP domain-containing protein [Acidimicrobiales bacterium]
MSKRRKNRRVSRVLVAGALASSGVVLPAMAAGAAASPNPFGYVDTATRVANGARLTGWTIDPNTGAPVDVHIYVDGIAAAVVSANGTRGDVGQSYPNYGAAHGFDVVVPLGAQVCAYGINVGPGVNTVLGCQSIPVSPLGRIDSVARGAGGTRLNGWAIDPDTGAPVDVHVYVDNRFVASTSADVRRDDIAVNMPGYGVAHGFDTTVPNGSQVCAYGINQGAGSNSLLGCSQTAPAGGNQIANDLMNRINGERAARGVGPLAWDENLAAGARDWAMEMSRSGMRHSPASGQNYGENIQYLSGATSGALHSKWMNSNAHRDNIVWPAYGSVGIGLYCAPDGVVWAVERFGQIDPAKQTPMGSPVNPIAHNDSGGPSC